MKLRSWPSMGSSAVGLALALWLGCVSCSDDAGAGTPSGGCTTDIECKGARLCIDHGCVDPEDVGSTGGHAGNAAEVDAGDADAASGSTGADYVDDPALEAACSRDCKAKFSAGCTAMNLGSPDQCLAQCLIIDEQNPQCLKERTAQYACLAAGGYTCTQGYPQPKSTCIAEAQAVATCQQKAPCRDYCDRAAGDCAPSGAECISTCEATQASFEDAICGVYYSQLLSCWGRDLECQDGKPVSATCEPSLAQVGDCLGRHGEECDGYCWLAEQLGCGSTSCLTDCMAKEQDSSCGSYYRSVLDCAYGSNALHVACEAGELAFTADCDSALQQYTMCMSM